MPAAPSTRVPAPHLLALLDHQTTLVDTATDKPPILLIHALGLDHRFWRGIYRALTPVGRFIAYDIRGHGCAHAAPLTRDIRQLAADAAHLLDALSISCAHVCGASFGGCIAQQMALDVPDRVRSLALIATAAHWPADELQRRARSAEADGMDAQVPDALMRWFLPETIAVNPWAVRYARNCVRRARVENWAAAWRALAAFDACRRLHDVRVPTLLLSGQQDQSSTPAIMRELAALVPHSDLRSLDPGTHMAVLEQPGAVSAQMGEFYGRII